MTNPTPMRQSVSNLADRLALSADDAIHATQSATNKAFDRLSGSVETARERVSPLVDKVVGRADQTSSFVQNEPLKALLIAAAAGVAVATLLNWLGRSRHRD